MKKRFSIVAIILAMDNILTPFSIAFGNEGDIFDIGENEVIENEITEPGSSEDIQEEESGTEREEQESSDEDIQGDVGSEEEASEDSQDEEIESLENEEQSITEIEVEQTEKEEQGSSIETNNENIETNNENIETNNENIETNNENIETNNDKTETENSLIDTTETQTGILEDTLTTSQNNESNTLEGQSGDVITGDIQESLTGIENDNTQTGTSLIEVSEIQTGTQMGSGEDTIEQQLPEDEDNQGTGGVIETITEEIQEIITKIRYFFKKEGDSRYIKYGRDSNNIGTVTLKDPKTSASITIMDKNLGAESVGVGRSSYGYYFQWGNNSGVRTVNGSNKTTEKAIYKDSYYNRGYDGKGMFIVGGRDYWENGDHYNSLWGNESKESSRYGSCPVGYHIPTVKEWNQLLSIWGKIHTQDTTKNETVLRYSADYATKNIHTFKGAATQCAQGETECVDEDKLSIIIETLSEELKLPLAGSYDENGNYEGGLGVYWTTVAKDGNKAGVFDMNVYIGNGADERFQYKSQGHNIRCFQNIYPYEAPVEIEVQGEEEKLGTGNEINSLDNKEKLENEKQVSYSGGNIPLEFISHTLVLDTTKDFMNVELGANGGKFSDEKESKTVKYGYYNEEATINVDALKQDEYRSGYEVEEILPTPVGYKLMDGVETPTREGYIFDGWYTEVDGGEKVDFENLLVSEGMKVYAHWTLKEYTIIWKNEDGTIRDITQVAYGQIPTHEDITQPADEKYTYTFKGWEPEIKEVTGDAEYRATYIYTLRKYIVTWKNEDETVLKTEEIEYGTTPTYNGEVPTKESTEEYEYTFAGWDKEISEVKGNVEYVARYDAKEIESEDIEDLPISSQNDENVSSLIGGNGGGVGIEGDILDIESESDSTLDLLEKTIETQTETGEVLEYTEEDRELELAQIRAKLNNKKIKGKETYNNITVNVEAPKNSFPEGVELRISPIVGDAENQAIKEQLMENGNVTAESELVSFDISFIYTLSNGEEVEIQPKDGNTVKVSFNYKNNNKFNKGKKDKNKDLKIYHFEKVKNKKNRKSEETKIKEIKVNESESTQGEIVIDAENFSIYTLAVADGGLRGVDMCTVTFQNGHCYYVKNGSQEADDGICTFDIPESIEVECGQTISRQDINEPMDILSMKVGNKTYYYYFSRWSSVIGPGGTNTSNNYNFSTPVTEDITLYAIGTFAYEDGGNHYERTVTFNANGGTLTSPSSIIYGDYGLVKQPSDPVREGYVLNCWTTSQSDTSCSNPYNFNSTTNTITSDIDLYAQWVSSYTIRFNANGGDGSIDDINAGRDKDYTLPDTGFSRYGYALLGWNTESDGSGTGYTVGQSVRNLSTNNGDIVILYAQWAEANRVTFDGNGGTVSVPYIDVISGQTLNFPTDPIYSRHRFLGWYLTGSDNEFSSSTPIISDITLYAHWEESQVLTVIFNSMGGGSVESQEVEYGERATKPTDPIKSGSGFMYWTTDEEGNNEYDFKTPVTEDLILYAQWAKICTVTFANGRCYRNQSSQSTCNFTLPDSIKVACGTPVRRPENPSPFKTSSRFNSYTYYFSRWSKVNNASYDNTSNDWNFDDPVTTDRTLYAMGNSTTYTVTFNANSGVLVGGSTQDVDTMGRNATVRKPDDPSRTGYDFKRWSRQNSTTEYDFTTQITTNTTLVAQWTPHTYTIRYNANGGVGSMDNTDMTYDVAKNLSLNTFIKDNASFSGWNTKTNGSGTPYGNGESVNNLTDVAGRTINLYAQWNCNNGYHDENGICVSDIQNCPLPAILGGGTLAHGSGMTVYSTAGGQCPTTCTAGTITCNNGILEGNTGYNYTGCNLTQLTCDASFTLNSTGVNGIYSGCTSYTVNANSCNEGTTKYKLINCANGYHTEDNSTCTGNTKTVACIQSGKPDHSSYVSGNVQITWQGTWNSGNWSTADNCAWTCDSHYHTGANNNSCEIDTFQITWKDGNGSTLKTDTVNYNETPVYAGTTPTKTATAQYSYTFNNTWSPTIVPATADATYTAQFNSVVNEYTITWNYRDANGEQIQSTNTVAYGQTPSAPSLPATSQSQSTVYTFTSWSPAVHSVDGTETYTAQYSESPRQYTITWKNDDGTTIDTTTVNYGATPTHADATKANTAQYTYTFVGWTPSIKAVTGDMTYTAQFNSIVNEYTATITATPNGYGSVSLASVKKDYNSDIVVDGNKITIGGTEVTATPTPSDAQYTYTFSGWTNTCGNNGTKLTGDCTVQAQFERTTNKYSIVFKNWDGAVLQSGMLAYGTTPTPPANPTRAEDAQYTYTFDTWSPNIHSVTGTQVYTAVYYSTINNYVVNVVSNNTNSGTVTTGSITVPYGMSISTDSNILTVGTQTSTANPNEWTQVYAFFFNDWDTSDCGATVTTGCTVTANFSSNLRTYTIQFFPNNSEYGKVNDSIVSSTSTRYGSPIVVNNSDGTVRVNSSVVTRATPTPSDDQYTYGFVGWDSDCGNELTHNCTITGNFTRTVNEYDVIFDSNGGDYTSPIQSIEYGSTATKPTPDPTKTGYEFSGWTLNGLDFDFSTPITGAINLVAKRNLVEYTITYNLNGGTNSPNNPATYTIESGAITLESPTRVGYTFLGWTGSNGEVAQTGVIISSGSDGNKVYNAVWQSSNVEYIIYHYVKKIGENKYILAETETGHGRTDDVLILLSLSKESQYPCASYDRGSLTGTENGPGEIVTQTTIKGDGSTKIYLYYNRNSYTVHLSGDKGVDYLEINGERKTEAVRECGSEVPVNAVPKPGYHFVRWDREENRRSEEEGEGGELPVK